MLKSIADSNSSKNHFSVVALPEPNDSSIIPLDEFRTDLTKFLFIEGKVFRIATSLEISENNFSFFLVLYYEC